MKFTEWITAILAFKENFKKKSTFHHYDMSKSTLMINKIMKIEV